MRTSRVKFAALAAGATLLLAASAQAVVISLTEATGDPGQTVEISAELGTEGDEVAGTQNDITFGDATSGVMVAARSNGRPDCAVNPDIEKGGTSFAFQPSGCTAGTDCTGVRALVLALDNVDPIPDESILYTCQVVIASDASAGEKTLSNTNTGASDPEGGALSTSGTDGRVIVAGGASDATIIVGSASGEAGDTVSFDVSLETGTDVAGTQNDIAFAAPIAIAARSNGRPDCTVNPEIEKGGTSFAFQPSGCTAGTDCTGVRALVLALDNVDPIPDGSVMYTCNAVIDAEADNGTYDLTCSNPGASDPIGGALLAQCTSGAIQVGGDITPTDTPTPTPTGPVDDTPTPTVTVTNTITFNTPTHTRTPGGRSNDDDGCAVVAPAHAGSGWLLLLPAAALLWLRRRNK